MNNPLDRFSEIFSENAHLDSAVIAPHIERLKELDKVLPTSSTFLMLTNTLEQRYEYFTKNIELGMGITREKLYKEGIKLFLEMIHPEEVELWLAMVKEMTAFIAENIKVEDRTRLDIQYNYRIKVPKEGKYLNVIENQIPVHYTDEGQIALCFGQVTLIGHDEELPIRGKIRILNQKNQYETLFLKNYSKEIYLDTLTNRENDIVRLLAMNNTSKEIGDKLCISHQTVDKHRKNILKKLGLNSTRDLVSKLEYTVLI